MGVEPAALSGPPWYRELAVDWFKALARKRRAPATVQTYVTPVRHLGRWLELEGIAEPHQLNRQVLDGWQDRMVAELGAKTHSVYAGAVRGLLRWGGREERIPPGLADWIEAPPVPHHDQLVLEREQLDQVAEHFRDPVGDLVYLRDRALFWFLLTSSVRISEALQLDVDQVDRRRRWVVVQKGGGEKTVIISAAARAWLEQYLRARGRDQEPALWIHVGPLVGRRRLNRADANRIWARLCAEVGIVRFTSRYLRGTSATELNELGNTAIDVAQHLGHRDLATVLQYAKLRGRREQDMVNGLDQLLPPPTPAPARARGRPRHRRGIQREQT